MQYCVDLFHGMKIGEFTRQGGSMSAEHQQQVNDLKL